MAFITTNDGAQIYYEETGSGKPLVLLHGWGCSPAFFKRNVAALAQHCRVINVALRGHAQSEKVNYGHRIARYAADLRDLIMALGLTEVTALGWSMGAAIIWSHYDLFRDDHLSKMVIVDQSPRQYAVFGGQEWPGIQAGCYDAESLMVLNTSLKFDSRGVATGVVGACFPAGVAPTPDETEFFVNEIEQTPWWVRTEIMVDHTNLDWRDLLPRITLPTLVIAGRKTQIFAGEGTLYPAQAIPDAALVVCEESGHLPFYHEPDKFNQAVIDFVTR